GLTPGASGRSFRGRRLGAANLSRLPLLHSPPRRFAGRTRPGLICGGGCVRKAVCAPAPRPDPAPTRLAPPYGPPGAVPPRRPPEVGPVAQRLGPRIGFLRLAAVLAARRHDQLADICPPAMRLTTGRQQAEFRVGARPEAEPGKEARLAINRRV